MFKKSRLFYWSVELTVAVVFIYICTKISFVFYPIQTLLTTLFVPVIISGFFYYLFKPLIRVLGRFGIKKNLAIAIIFIIFLGGILWIAASLIPNLINQITQLIKALPKLEKSLAAMYTKYSQSGWLSKTGISSYVASIDLSPTKLLKQFMTSFTSSFGSVFSQIAGMTVTALTIPIMLFYMLKDGDKLIPSIQRFLPSKRQSEAADLLETMSSTISKYISGQAIDCLFVGTLTVIGYVIVGMPYGLLLGVFAGLCNIIPYVGPYIGIVPALVVALAMSPGKIALVIIVVVVVHLLDGNIIYPNVIGKTLNIHPLTIIVLLLIAGNIGGLFGMILCIPFYAVAKTIVQYVLNIYRLRKTELNSQTKE